MSTPKKTKTNDAGNPLAPEISLDPKNWEEFRALAHATLDEAVNYLRGVAKRPPWRPVSEEAKAALQSPAPEEGRELEDVLEDFKTHIFPYPLGNIHPRHWGWVNGSGTAEGVLAEMLAAAMNSNITSHDQSPIWVEMQVLSWFKGLFDYPENAAGLLVSGGTTANLTALLAARAAKAGYDVRGEGLGSKKAKKYTLYTSAEAHYCITKAADILGLGKNACRLVPVLEDFTINVGALKKAIRDDRQAGFTPMAIVGNAGTVNTGAIDPLAELGDLAKAEGMWFHVDGAFGAVAYFSDKLKPRLKGLDKADSIAFDLHKWLYQPYGTGCVLVRDGSDLDEAFSFEASYFKPLTRGISTGPMRFNDIGIEHSRRFRALAFWFSLNLHGLDKFRNLLEQNCRQAEYLASLIEASPVFELTSPVKLNVVTFRYNPGGLDEEALDNLNRLLIMEIQTRGIAVPSATTLKGAFVLRCAIVNHRSKRSDFETLVKAAGNIGRDLEKGL